MPWPVGLSVVSALGYWLGLPPSAMPRLPLALFSATALSLAPFAHAVAPQEPAPTPPRDGATAPQWIARVGDVEIRRWEEAGEAHAAWRPTGALGGTSGGIWRPMRQPDDRLHFAYATFDPLREPLQVPPQLAAPAGTRLFVVQFQTQVIEAYHGALARAGVEVLHFLPANALYVRGDAAQVAALRELPFVRWVGELPDACKLDAELRAFVLAGEGEARECALVLSARSDRARLIAQIEGLGGRVTEPCEGSPILQALLTPHQLQALLQFDTVTWADVVTPDGFDMDNARIQGGGNYVETVGGYLGQGVRAEITESIQETHPDFSFGARVQVRGTNSVANHGHCTAGIVGGSGANNFNARGMMPLCLLTEGAYSGADHHGQILGSVDPALPWRTMVATASWGATQTLSYTTRSQSMDAGLFEGDLTRLNSQSNTGNQNSRPEAWAKNIISVGGVRHGNNSNPLDDNWTNSGSIGPALDGRLKPDICAYYDSVLTSDRTGASGYATGDYYSSFGGTSAATPIVAGHVGLLMQMFTDGLFHNPLPMPATDQFRFENKPHMTTSKALLCNTAAQYTFSGAAHDLTRVHQGWGFPDLRRAYDNRDRLVVLDEYDTLQLGQSRTYHVWVAPGTPEFRATMVYADPAAQASAAVTLVNDLDLKVTRFSDGASWWGNRGLDANMFSTGGGAPNNRDPIECVYLQNPQPGLYLVTVAAASVVQDGKLETPQFDVDFALVMHPVAGGYHDQTGMTLDLASAAPGDLTMTLANLPATPWTDGFTALSFTPTTKPGFGRFFGIEDDAITVSLWSSASAPGNPFHFTNGGTGYPFASFTFDPALISLLSGLTLEGVAVLWNGADIVAVSNADQVVLQ